MTSKPAPVEDSDAGYRFSQAVLLFDDFANLPRKIFLHNPLEIFDLRRRINLLVLCIRPILAVEIDRVFKIAIRRNQFALTCSI